VVGLARSGQAAARLLRSRGAEVSACDIAEPEGASELEADGVEVELESDGIDLLEGAATLVKSPGVPREAPVVAAALERGTIVLGELELAWRLLPNRFLAVTGTNGKTTVAELLGHIHREAGAEVAVAGNVGTPLASLVGEIPADASVVCECSSFQLEDAIDFAPEVAALLNIATDHLDRHGSMEDYLGAKLRIFAKQRTGDVAAINGSDHALAAVEPGGEGEVVRFCSGEGMSGDCVTRIENGQIVWRGESVAAVEDLALAGQHGVENSAAAATMALEAGVPAGAVGAALRDFPGVSHRLETVAEIDGVTFVNDSKATNVAAARAGILSFGSGVRVILGGSLKGERFGELAGPVRERCVACYLVGEAADALSEDLAPVEAEGIPVRRFGGLEEAVSAAAGDATTGETVLLSPACASFDAFSDFEQRGRRFVELVEALR